VLFNEQAMKKIIATLLVAFLVLSAFGQGDKKPILLFDGFYETECYTEKGDDEGGQDYLRFYANGKVIGVYTGCEGTVDELKPWFNINAEQVGIGDYKIRGKKLFFTTETKTGLVKYKGRINNNGLIKLKWKSLINGRKGHTKFKFINVTDMT
jgi:hypothetical protein